MAIARRLGLPRRTMVVLEGEGLANDATALIDRSLCGRGGRNRRLLLRGRHSSFTAIIAGEIAFGLVIAAMQACDCANGHRTRASRSSYPCLLHSLPIGLRRHSAARACSHPSCAASTSAGTGRCSYRAPRACRESFFGNIFIFILEGALFLLTGLQARPLLRPIRPRRAHRSSSWPPLSPLSLSLRPASSGSFLALPAALADPEVAASGPVSDLAAALPHLILRRPWHSLSCRRPRSAVDCHERRAISPS